MSGSAGDDVAIGFRATLPQVPYCDLFGFRCQYRAKMQSQRNILLAAFATAAMSAPAPQADFYSASAGPPGTVVPPPPVIPHTDVVSHGPYRGIPTTTGAVTTDVLAPSIAPLPPNPTATTYLADGKLHAPQPAPYTPAGGLGTNGTEPVYNVKSDFDFQSLVSLLVPLT